MSESLEDGLHRKIGGEAGKVGRKEWAVRIGIDHVDQGRPQSQFRRGFFVRVGD
jgi:hypothetical protein